MATDITKADLERAKSCQKWAAEFRHVRGHIPNEVLDQWLQMTAGGWSFEGRRRLRSALSAINAEKAKKTRRNKKIHEAEAAEKARQHSFKL